MFSDYDGLHERLLADLAPAYRVIDARRGVVATIDHDLQPCLAPCRFAFDGQRLYAYPVSSEASEHLTAAPSASLLVTAPDDDQTGGAPWWCRVEGPAIVVDEENNHPYPEWEVDRASELFAEKYGDAAPTDAPTLRIDIEQWTAFPADDAPPA